MIFSKDYWNYRWLMIGKKAKWIWQWGEKIHQAFFLFCSSQVLKAYIYIFISFFFCFLLLTLFLLLSLHSIFPSLSTQSSTIPVGSFISVNHLHLSSSGCLFFSCCISPNHLPSFKLSLLRSFLPLVWLISSILPASLPSIQPLLSLPALLDHSSLLLNVN